MEQKKINRLLVVLIMLVLALAIGFFYAIHSSSEKEQQITAMQEMMEFEKQQLEKEYGKIAMELDGYTMNIKNDSLLSLFNQEKMRVNQLLDELKITKSTNVKRISELKTQLGNARSLLAKYVNEIDSLNIVNKNLTVENGRVKEQYYAASHTNELLEKEKSSLKETLSNAAIMNVSNFTVRPFDKKNRSADRASKITQLQINYTISKNTATKTGLKTAYLRLLAPNGKLMTKSPDAFFTYKSKEIGYSLSKDFNYTGDNFRDTMTWNVEDPLELGSYKAEFYIDGNMVGAYTFKLDKK